MGDWPAAARIETARLTLEPLRLEHAEEMVEVLDDQRLHEFIGGEPLTRAQLRDRYRRLACGHSPDGREGWLNWMLRVRDAGALVGTVQATLSREPAGLSAELAWVVAVTAQGHGYAKEAATGVLAWLAGRGVTRFVARIHPEHVASRAVAEAIGFRPTARVIAGETLWLLTRRSERTTR
jgi:RimJ/RimL family protein N-acetyltransferase